MATQALVVGAAGGLGSAVAQQLVDRGYRVVGTVMDGAQRDELTAKLPALAGIAIIDLANADHIADGLAQIMSDETPLNVVAVCAAISPFGPVETTSLAALRRTYEINTISSVAVYQAALPHLRRTKGRLALVSSFAGRIAFPMLGHYSSSKFALEALADVMRRESSRWGVDIIVIEPGGIQTTMVTDLQKSVARERAAMTDGCRELYGDLYISFEQSTHGGYENATPPGKVAEVIVDALTGRSRPETRYPIGADGVHLCGLSRTMSDQELDQLARLETANDQLTRSASRTSGT